MKEERLAILGMLEKGIITVDEAERLLNTLQNGSMFDKEGIGAAVGGALEKAGAALGVVAKKAGETAEKMQPKVKNAAFRVKEKTYEWKDDAAYYKEKLRRKRKQSDEESYDFEDIAQACRAEETPVQDIEAHSDAAVEEVKDLETEQYAQKMEGAMDSIQEQMSQIDAAEDFLRQAFGDVEEEDLAEDEAESQKGEKPEA